MYYPNDIEDVCYVQSHINQVWEEINATIPAYLQEMIETEGGTAVTNSDMEKLAAKFGASAKAKPKHVDAKAVLERLLKSAIEDFEKERAIYQRVLDAKALEEYKHDVGSFKNTVLKNEVPIIRKTLQNKLAKELDKFRKAFNLAQPGELFKVTNNISALANKWREEWYNSSTFEHIGGWEEMGYDELDSEDYTAFGVIGGGIKSTFLYKLFPEMFPCRNREAVWALYYLSKKQAFGCKEESEFLMINAEEGTTHHNYFYPYGLFAFYTLLLFNRLKQLYAKLGVNIPVEYRFVAVDAFLSFVARKHQDEIDDLKKNANKNYQYEH